MSDELDDLDLFGSDDMAIPTMRGNANLDIQDYADISSEGTFLDDDLQEDVRSTPGSGAAPAPDVEGTSQYEMEPEYDGPDAQQTTFGASPWGPGAGGGYRPMSMARTDLSGNEDAAEITVDSVMKVSQYQPSQMNRMPSNADVDPETMYDRTSYEFASGSDAVIGNGIFEMEEGVTWRAEDGSFSHQYAFPAYIAEEDELGTQQSEMFDVVADNWRVVQPSGGGVTFSTTVPRLRGRPMIDRTYSPFTNHLRPGTLNQSSRIEKFGRDAASVVLLEAASKASPADRQAFLVRAIGSLGPGMAEKCHKVAERMIRMGMPAQKALQDTIAHCAMHAAISDLSSGRQGTRLPSLDAMGAHVVKNKAKLRKSAVENLAPLTKNKAAAKADIAKLYQSPAAAGMGEVASEPAAPASAPVAPAAPAPIAQDNTVRNVALGVAAGVAIWAIATHTKKGQEVTAAVVANTRSALGLKANKKRRRSRRSK